MQYESERIEYKSQMIDDIYKEVIAFANTEGGVIYIGIAKFTCLADECVCADEIRQAQKRKERSS